MKPIARKLTLILGDHPRFPYQLGAGARSEPNGAGLERGTFPSPSITGGPGSAELPKGSGLRLQHGPLHPARSRRTGILFDGDNLCIPGVFMYMSFQHSAPSSSALCILRRTSWWRTFSAGTSKNQGTPLSGYPIGTNPPRSLAFRNFTISPVSRNGISVPLN